MHTAAASRNIYFTTQIAKSEPWSRKFHMLEVHLECTCTGIGKRTKAGGARFSLEDEPVLKHVLHHVVGLNWRLQYRLLSSQRLSERALNVARRELILPEERHCK